jgi:SulP family sulfate permease
MLNPRDSSRQFVPALRPIRRDTFVSDLIAGTTVGLVALPLAMHFAISSGMTPQAGRLCAIVTGIVISASAVQCPDRWPTVHFVVVVAASSRSTGIDALFIGAR